MYDLLVLLAHTVKYVSKPVYNPKVVSQDYLISWHQVSRCWMLKGLFTNFEYITFFYVWTEETFFMKGPSQ